MHHVPDGKGCMRTDKSVEGGDAGDRLASTTLTVAPSTNKSPAMMGPMGRKRKAPKRVQAASIDEVLSQVEKEAEYFDEDLDVFEEEDDAYDPSDKVDVVDMENLAEYRKKSQKQRTRDTYASGLKTIKKILKDNDRSRAMESDLTASDAAYFMRLLHDALVAGKLEYAYNSVRGFHNALADVWKTQGLSNKESLMVEGGRYLADLMDYEPYRVLKIAVLRGIEDSDRPANEDPAKGTAADCYTTDQFDKLMKMTYELRNQWFWHAMMAFCHQSLARNDDVLLVRFAHMMPPDRRTDVGPSTFWVFHFILRGNKTGKDNRAKYLSIARGKCIYKERIKPLLINADICTSKVCHAFRAGGAKAADLMVPRPNGSAKWTQQELLQYKPTGFYFSDLTTLHQAWDLYTVGKPITLAPLADLELAWEEKKPDSSKMLLVRYSEQDATNHLTKAERDNLRKRRCDFVSGFIVHVKKYIEQQGSLEALWAWEGASNWTQFKALMKIPQVKDSVWGGCLPSKADINGMKSGESAATLLLNSSPVRNLLSKPLTASPLQPSPFGTGLSTVVRQFAVQPGEQPHPHSPETPNLEFVASLQELRLSKMSDDELKAHAKTLQLTSSFQIFSKVYKKEGGAARSKLKVTETTAQWKQLQADDFDKVQGFEATALFLNTYLKTVKAKLKARGLEDVTDKHKRAADNRTSRAASELTKASARTSSLGGVPFQGTPPRSSSLGGVPYQGTKIRRLDLDQS
eukprot:gene30716-35746_t